MKKALPILLLCIFFLISCGMSNHESRPDVESSERTGDVTNTNQDVSKEDTSPPYKFSLFHLEANVEDVKIEVEYEERPFRTKASYDNKLHGIKFNGEEALKELDPIFHSFTFNRLTSEKAIVEEVMKAFVIPEDANEVTLEIEFNDGTTFTYEH